MASIAIAPLYILRSYIKKRNESCISTIETSKRVKKNSHMLGLVSIIIVLLMAVAAQNALCAADPYVSFTKTVAPVTPAECNKWLVTVTAAGVGTYTKPVDVLLVIDRSGSMGDGTPSRLSSAKSAAISFANLVLASGNPGNRIGVVSFASDVTTNTGFTTSLTAVTNAINGLNAYGGTNTENAFNVAGGLFPTTTPCDRVQALIFLSDGVPTVGSLQGCGFDGDSCPDGYCGAYTTYPCTRDCCNYPGGPNCCTNGAIYRSSTAKSRANVYSIGLVAGMTEPTLTVARAVFNGVQDSGYHEAPSPSDLAAIYAQIAGQLQLAVTNGAVTEIIDSVGTDFNIVGTPTTTSGTAAVSGNVITWNGFNVPFGTPATLTYIITPKSGVCGDQILGASSMTYTTVTCTSNTLTAISAPTSASVTCLTAVISPDPTVVCQGSTLQLNGNPSLNGVPLADGAAGYTHKWTGTGATYLSADNIQKPIFQSGAPAGSYTLTYTVTDSRGCTATDTNTITVQAGATAAAGPDQTICEGSTVPLAGSASNHNGITWSGGTGTYAPNENTLTAVYTPSTSEITVGSVELTLTAAAKSPCSVAATDKVKITIQKGAHAAAGLDQTICAGNTVTLAGSASNHNGITWSGGTGTYAPNENTLNAVYTPSASEITAGSVELTLTAAAKPPCSVAATDKVKITIQAGATAAAGPDQTICAGSTVTLAGSASNHNGITWSGGSGTFAPNVFTLTAVYTPSASEITAGSVELTLTAAAKSPCSVAATDKVKITIQAGATAAAGSDQTICAGSTVPLAGSASNHNGITWSGGSGTYAPNEHTLNAVYTPSASEITAGSVELTLTAAAILPCSLDATDKVKITIHSEPTVNAGLDQTVCKGSTVQLAGSASNDNGVTWSGGTGTFSPDANTLDAIYTPSDAELAAGSPITLTLTATGISPCPDKFDQMVITMQGGPTVVAPGPQRICSADLSLELTGTAENFAPGSLSWTIISGPGTVTQSITDPKKATYSVDPAYYQHPDANPPYTETVVRFAATGISPCTNSVHSDVTIRVDQRPIANIVVLVP
ncbi:MAG: VWA domain-containing protein [Methanothrix sp.]